MATIIEDAKYMVRITLTTTIEFSPIDRDRVVTKQDAIENAFGTVDYGTEPTVWDILEGEGWNIEAEAERVGN